MDTQSRYNTTDVAHIASAQAGHDHDHDHRTAEPMLDAKRETTVDFGDGWYHDAAITDAKEARFNPYQ